MKRLFLILLLCVPCLLQAGIIVTKNNSNIDNVTNIIIGETEITYEQDGLAKSISKDEVSAILYDDGRYEEIQTINMQNSKALYENNNYTNHSAPNQVYSLQWYFGRGEKIYYREGSTQVACNVMAYGNNKGGAYKIDHACDSIRIEYRVFYNNQAIEPDWKYLGTTPFARLTNSAQQNPFFSVDFNYSKMDPLVIDDVHLSAKIEFRLSKEGYKPTIITPIVIFDKPDYSNIYYILFLKPLKPLRGKEASKSMNKETNDSPSNTSIIMDPSDASSPKKIIPQICYTEGKNVYDAVYKEGQIQAVRRGYSKAQAISIAGEFAEQAKQKAIDECYESIVVHDEEFALGSSRAGNASESFFEIYELSSSAKQMMPQACTDEGKKVYDAAYAEAEAKALRQGYSKSQAKTVASEAAEKAKKKAIDECFDKVVNQGQDYYSADDITASEEIKSQEAKAKEEAKIQEAKKKEDANAREAEAKRLEEKRMKQAADSIKAAKETKKHAVKEKSKKTKPAAESESGEKSKKMLVGLSFGAGVPIAQWYRKYDKNLYDGYSFGIDGQISLDLAFPTSRKFAMGFYIAGGGGLAFRNQYTESDGNKHKYANNELNYKATAGLLMVMGDFTNKGAFLLGLGAGYGQVGNRFMDPIIPVEARFGGVFKNGFYFSIDAAISPMNLTPYNDFYVEPSIRFGYNFGNLIASKNKVK